MTDLWRRYWPVDLLAVVVLVVVVLFGSYLSERQHLADVHNQRTRESLCAIIDRIPDGVDSGVDKARVLDGCGKPHPPEVFFGHPFPTPRATRTTTREVPVVVPAPGPTATVTARPAPSRSPAPRPSPTHTPSAQPSPSPTCVLVVCIKGVVGGHG